MRVFLHNLAWKQDPAGFLDRMDKFLAVADKHHIRIMFVLLDSVWDPNPQIGKQREPKPHAHNSGWVQAPGAAILKNPASWSDRNRALHQGSDRPLRGRSARGHLGSDERARQRKRLLQIDRTAEQGGGRGAVARQSLGLGAQREAVAAADQRRLEETRLQRRLRS